MIEPLIFFIIIVYILFFFLIYNSICKQHKHKHKHIVNIEGTFYEIRNKKDMIEKTLLNNEQWSPKILELLKSRMKQKGHFVNVGAHIGTITLPMAKISSKVTAFEPFPKTFNHLKKNIELNNLRNVDIYNLALGDKYENIFFMDDNNDRLKNNNGGIHVFTSNDLLTGKRSSSRAKLENTGTIGNLNPITHPSVLLNEIF